MWFSRLRYREIGGGPQPIWLGATPRRWSECPARLLVDLAGHRPDGHPEGGTLLVSAPGLALADHEGVRRWVGSLGPLVRAEPSYWYDAGDQRAALALAVWLHLHLGWDRSRAMAAVGQSAERLRAADRQLWWGSP